VITKAAFGRSGGQYHTGIRFHIFCGYAGKLLRREEQRKNKEKKGQSY
jgi:hypothetical protein